MGNADSAPESGDDTSSVSTPVHSNHSSTSSSSNCSDDKVLRGNCACGAISYTIPKSQDNVHACHCSTCQKWTGGVLISVDGGKNPTFTGAENLKIWKSSKWAERGFCSHCGSSLFYKVTVDCPFQNEYHFCAGTLENYQNMTLNKEVYIDRKPKAFTFKQQGPDHTYITKKEVESMLETVLLKADMS